MKCLFINPEKKRCGVHQYGARMWSLLKDSNRVQFSTTEPDPDVVLYNWHPCIDPNASVLSQYCCRKAIFYHNGQPPMVDMVFFSNPSDPQGSPTWTNIGRPLPEWEPTSRSVNGDGILRVGIYGFGGAWAVDAVSYLVTQPFNLCIKLLIPPSDYLDPTCAMSHSTLDICKHLIRAGDSIEHTMEFLPETALLAWLSDNHVNCFVRHDVREPGGISSVLDNALAVRRPIAINGNPMFRYLHHCNPSILIENTPMRDIVANGLAPLIPVYQRNDRQVVRAEVEKILLSL